MILLAVQIFAEASEAECKHEDLQRIEVSGTCTEPGYWMLQCATCYQTVDSGSTPQLGHDYTNWMEITAASCKNKGLEERVCRRCNYTDSRTLDKLAHVYDDGVVVEPTCKKDGYTLYTCTLCGSQEKSNTVCATGEHQYEESLATPTCTKEGYTLRTCTVCGDQVKTDYVSANGHNFQESYVLPTCKKDGYTLLTCSVCYDQEKAEIISALGHQYEATVVAPTCTANGYTRYCCVNCGDTYRTDTVLKTGHIYDNGVFTKEPTWTTMGRKTYTCIGCGNTYQETTPKMSNPFVDVTSTDYYYDAIAWAVARGITTGTDSTHFSPGTICTRAQMVTFLWRKAGEPDPESNNCAFTDISEEAYYYEAVLWAVEQGITNGVDETHFAPNQTCTRGQVVTFMYRAEESPQINYKSGFQDVSTAAYYYSAVCWAAKNGITTGTTSVTFSPDDPCTRGQIVTFLYRATDL